MGDVRDQGPVQQTGGATNGKAGTPVIVDVYAKDVGRTVEFSHRWRFDGGSDQGNGAIIIPQAKKGDPGHPIHYHLRDETKEKLSFVDDPDEVIWVLRSSCPQSRSSDPEIININPTPNLLKVYDRNEEECELHYNLRF